MDDMVGIAISHNVTGACLGLDGSNEKKAYDRGYDKGFTEGNTKGHESGYNEGYKSGQQSMVDESKLIPKTVSSENISVNDVSEIPHSVECNIKSINLFDCANAQRSSSPIGYNYCEIVQRTEDSITVRKATDNLWEFIAFDLPDGLEGKSITIHGEWTCSGDNTGMIRVGWNNNFTNSILISNSGSIYTMTIPDKPEGASKLVLLLYGGSYSGNKGDEVYYKNVMVSVGEWPGKFTPYVSPENVTVTKYGTDETEGYQTIIPHPDGVVEGLTSVSPNMNIFADVEGVMIEATYNKSYGMQMEYDRFWENYQLKGTRGGYNNAFAGYGWTQDNFKPLYDIVPSSAYMMFYTASMLNIDLVEHLEKLGISLDTSKCANLQYMFGSSGFTKVGVIDTTSCPSLSYVFGSATKLVTIDKLKLKSDGSQTINSDCFNYCSSLENIIIEGVIGVNNWNFKWSTKLTKDSITSIINALSDKTKGLTITFSATAKTNAFTDEEWNTLIAKKSNWTIALV